jgi:uncharacterized RDD family membrane protein YckC
MPPPAAPSYPQPGQFPPPPPAGYPVAPGGPAANPYASWGIRLGGWLIDGVILYVVQIIIGLGFKHSNALVVHFHRAMSNGTVRHGRFDLLVLIITAVIGAAYATIMIGARGQTVGMMAVGIRAVRADSQGPVGMGLALGRSLIALLLGIIVIPLLISDLAPLWDARRQTWQDKAVATVVVRSRM